MKQSLLFIALFVVFLSCQTKDGNEVANKVQLLMADTTNNNRAKWDMEKMGYYSKLEKQLGLSDLKQGADSIEIRVWECFAFSGFQELYRVNLQDTNCIVSYYRVYLRPVSFDDQHRKWNPFTHPIIDSAFSKATLINNAQYQTIHCDSIWLLKSQSELNIPDSIGFTDCSGEVIEMADKRRFKFILQDCPTAYYEITKLQALLDFGQYAAKIMWLARNNNVTIPYSYPTSPADKD